MGNAKIERQYMGKMTPFRLAAPFQPMGDQPKAVKSLTDGLRDGHWAQVLLGATGTGKTFTMAKVIEEMQRPTLIISPNKSESKTTALPLNSNRLPVNLKTSFLITRCIIL